MSAANIKTFHILLDQRLDKEGVDVSPETMQLAQLLQRQYQQQPALVEAPQSVVSRGLNASSFPVHTVRRFTGTSVDKDQVIQIHGEFEQFAVGLLEGRSVPKAQHDVILTAFLRYILQQDAVRFSTQLRAGDVEWRYSPEGFPDVNASRPPSTCSELQLAFDGHYLSTEAFPRAVETLISLQQGERETVDQLHDRRR